MSCVGFLFVSVHRFHCGEFCTQLCVKVGDLDVFQCKRVNIISHPEILKRQLFIKISKFKQMLSSLIKQV